MKVVITSATEKEVLQIKQVINSSYIAKSNGLQVLFNTSGVGILSSAFSITTLIFKEKPDLIIQAGIAGTFNNQAALGKVVAVKEEFLADTGVEENGLFKDLFDLNLQQENTSPFINKKLVNPALSKFNLLHLDEVTGVTINEITTRAERILQLKEKYNAETESMEGASLHYCCLQTNTPFIQIRAISNYIGERDKSKWNFKDSLENLSTAVITYIEHLHRIKSLAR